METVNLVELKKNLDERLRLYSLHEVIKLCEQMRETGEGSLNGAKAILCLGECIQGLTRRINHLEDKIDEMQDEDD